MARRRVFRTKVECTGVDAGRRRLIIGEAVSLLKSPTGAEVQVVLKGIIVGCLDEVVGPQVASAISHGQSFSAKVQRAYQVETFANANTWIELRVEYLLDRRQLAIEIPKRSLPEERGEPRSFFTKIAGVTFPNPDGSSRQRIIKECRVGEALFLIREPNNPVDQFAVKVVRENGQQLGYLGRHVAREGDPSGIAYRMDRGEKYLCRISDITGGGRGRSYGVNIQIREADGRELWGSVRNSNAKAPIDTSPTATQVLIALAVVGIICILVVVIFER